MKARRIKSKLIPLIMRMRRIRKARDKMSYEDVLNLQRAKLEKLVRHAMQNSPLYRDLYKSINLGNFEIASLPTISKGDIMARFSDSLCVRDLVFEDVERFVADPSRAGELYKGKYVITHTSGTTGKPGIFVIDEACWHEGAALTAVKPGPLKIEWGLLLSLPIRPLYRFRFAAIIATRGHLASHVTYLSAPEVRKLFVKMEEFDILMPYEELLDRVKKFKPQFVHSYPTILKELAQAQLAGQIDLKLKAINVSSEYFDPSIEAICRKAFPDAVFEEVYGTTECMPMARRCCNDMLHVIAEAAIIEPVNQNDKPVGFGEISHHILLTNLFNFTQPLIRYQLSDAVRLWHPSKCGCGSPLPVIEVFGRTNDVLRLPNKDGGEVHVLPVQIYLGIHGIEDIERYQVIHGEPSIIVVKFVCKEGVDVADVKRRIEEKLKKVLLGLGARVDVKAELSEVERDPTTGKFQQIIERVGAS